jgi:hypothetical protein
MPIAGAAEFEKTTVRPIRLLGEDLVECELLIGLTTFACAAAVRNQVPARSK